MKRNKGFSIVELVIVIAIIGLLASVAIPAYQSYAIRAKHAEALLTASGCRTSVSEVFQSSPSVPFAGWGCNTSAASSQYVASVEVNATGTIIVTTRGIRNREDGSEGGRLTLAPLGENGQAAQPGMGVAKWRCGAVADGTDVARNVLPRTCAAT